jgi:DNA polymerase III subunit gamma/tau
VETDPFADLALDHRARLMLRAAVADPVHAYLLSGPPESAADDAGTLLAAALAGITSTQVAEGHPDVIEAIREGQVIRLEQIAAIWQAVHLRPHSGERVVAIIREAEAMSEIVQNALLKSIEEPPPYVKFMMATTELHLVPITIQSRSQVFELKTIGVKAIADQLRKIADAEKIGVGEDALMLIARAGDGSMRDAQSAFDQVIAFAGETITA